MTPLVNHKLIHRILQAGSLIFLIASCRAEAGFEFLRTTSQGPYEVVSRKAESAPVIDGALDEAVWTNVVRVGAFMLRNSLSPAKQQTIVFLAHSSSELYIAFVCEDTDVFVEKKRERDGRVYLDDAVEVFLDPDYERGKGYHFLVNPDNVLLDIKEDDRGWNAASFASAVGRFRGGWTVEMVMPFSDLDIKQVSRGELWGLKLTRGNMTRTETGDKSAEPDEIAGRRDHSDDIQPAVSREMGGGRRVLGKRRRGPLVEISRHARSSRARHEPHERGGGAGA